MVTIRMFLVSDEIDCEYQHIADKKGVIKWIRLQVVKKAHVPTHKRRKPGQIRKTVKVPEHYRSTPN